MSALSLSNQKFQVENVGVGEDKEGQSITFSETHYYEDLGEFSAREDEKIWGGSALYKDVTAFYLTETDEVASPISLEEKISSVSSELSIFVSEEETEEERELKRERETLIEAMRRKIVDRIVLRRKNAFLHKKLIEHFKKRRMEYVLKEDPKGLDLENKYLKRLFAFNECKNSQEKEIEELTESMGNYEISSKKLKEEYEEKMKNFRTRAKEVSLSLISTKTGRKLNEKVVDRLLRRHDQKNEEKGKKKLKYIQIKNLIEEKNLQLKTMEYVGEGLHIVDYEQMKIDNQNYADKIEEKEDELTKMRLKTQEIIQNLAHVREKSYAIEGDIELMEEKVYDVDLEFIATRERLTVARKKRDSLREELGRLKRTSGLLNKDRLLKDFESSIFEAKNLSKTLDKLRKVISDKKRQENALAKIVKNPKASDMLFSFDIKISRSKIRRKSSLLY